MVQIATNGDNPAFANIATVNGAVMLQQTLNTTPALVPGERTDALALAEAYGQATAFAMEQDPSSVAVSKPMMSMPRMRA